MLTSLPTYLTELAKCFAGSSSGDLISNFDKTGREADDYRAGMLAVAFSNEDPEECSGEYTAGKAFITSLSKFEANYRVFKDYSDGKGAYSDAEAKEAADVLHSLCQILLNDPFAQQALYGQDYKDSIERNCWKAARWLARRYPKNRVDGATGDYEDILTYEPIEYLIESGGDQPVQKVISLKNGEQVEDISILLGKDQLLADKVGIVLSNGYLFLLDSISALLDKGNLTDKRLVGGEKTHLRDADYARAVREAIRQQLAEKEQGNSLKNNEAVSAQPFWACPSYGNSNGKATLPDSGKPLNGNAELWKVLKSDSFGSHERKQAMQLIRGGTVALEEPDAVGFTFMVYCNHKQMSDSVRSLVPEIIEHLNKERGCSNSNTLLQSKLQSAVLAGNNKQVEKYLRKGANPSLYGNKMQDTILFQVVSRASQIRATEDELGRTEKGRELAIYLEVIRTLIANGAKLNDHSMQSNNFTPLTVAVAANNLPVAETLLTGGADPTIVSCYWNRYYPHLALTYYKQPGNDAVDGQKLFRRLLEVFKERNCLHLLKKEGRFGRDYSLHHCINRKDAPPSAEMKTIYHAFVPPLQQEVSERPVPAAAFRSAW